MFELILAIACGLTAAGAILVFFQEWDISDGYPEQDDDFGT